METNKKFTWKKPSVQTIEEEQVVNEVIASACSKYFEICSPSNWYIDSIPELKPEIM